MPIYWLKNYFRRHFHIHATDDGSMEYVSPLSNVIRDFVIPSLPIGTKNYTINASYERRKTIFRRGS